MRIIPCNLTGRVHPEDIIILRNRARDQRDIALGRAHSRDLWRRGQLEKMLNEKEQDR